MALDGMHEVRKAGAPGMGPSTKRRGGLEGLGKGAQTLEENKSKQLCQKHAK